MNRDQGQAASTEWALPRSRRPPPAADWPTGPIDTEPQLDGDHQRASAVWSYDDRRTNRADTAEPAEDGGRLLFIMLFWFGLATGIELWWLGTETPLTNVGDIVTAAGRLAGMAGGFALLVQILLMSRVRWLERWIGIHDLMSWHRKLGAFVVFAVLGHVALIIVGYAAISDAPVVDQARTMFRTYDDVLEAFVAAGLLTLLGVLAIRGIRRLLPYELWYWLHLTSYLVVLLGYAHQFTYGRDLAAGFGRQYWIGLHVFVASSVGWGRVISPLRLNVRHQFRVVDVMREGTEAVSIYIGGRRLDRLQVSAGQHFRWRFLTRGLWWQAHPFSLSAAPNGRWLRVTVKAVGGHTEELQFVQPGVRVLAQGPAGVFTAHRRVRPRALLIAGGSGITPVRALLEEMPPGTVVIYRASSAEELVFRDELDQLAYERGAYVWYVLGERHDPGPRRLFTPRGLRELVPDVRMRDVYVCGPAGLVEISVKTLRRLRVPRRQIHLDPFEF